MSPTFNALACFFQMLLWFKVSKIYLDNQGYKEMKGHMLWLQLTSDQKNIESRQKQQKPLVYNSFYASKLLDYLLDFVMQGHNHNNNALLK